MRGLLTAIECSNNGATLVLTADGKTMRFHSGSPNQIRFSAATASSLPGPLGCGPLPGGGAPAIIYYRAEGSSGNAGEPLAVEFAGTN